MRRFLFILLFLYTLFSQAQLLELDYWSPSKKESVFKVTLFKEFMLSANTLGHLDSSTEAIKIKYGSKKGIVFTLSVVGTQSLITGNKNDKLNTLSHLLNPLGGRVNGSFFIGIPIKQKDKSSYRLAIRAGKKLIQAVPLKGLENNFLTNYGQLGGVYQNLIFEDALENESIDLWIYPHVVFNHTNEKDLSTFFEEDLKSIAYGYGIQAGLEFNRKVKAILLLNQFLNTNVPYPVGKAVLRFTISYRF